MPNAKITAVIIAGAITTILVWAGSLAHIAVPGEVASALTILIAAAAGYWKKS